MNAPPPKGALLKAPTDFGQLRLQLRSICLQAERVHSFELVHPDGELLPEVTAGSHIDVHLPGELVRSYSLAGDPSDRTRWTLGVLRELASSGGSRAMHESLRVGELVTLSLPRNAFSLADEARHSVLLAGGIGITPLKSMAHALAAQGRSFELHYCARGPAQAAFTSELRSLVPESNLHFHFDGGDASRNLDLRSLLAQPGDGRHVYFCGPAGFMKACADATAHWPKGTVHSEHFKAPEKPSVAEATSDTFEVKLARTGVTVQVPPHQTIVRAIELAGHRVPTSCLSGLCGSCKVDYLEGEVDHRDYILSDEEKERCLTVCVSRSKSPCLVLDL